MRRNDRHAFDLPPARRIAVVGGAGGIGRVLVDHLMALEARVAVLDLAASLARHAPREGVLAATIDVTDEESVARAFASVGEAFGALDGLVNLAGFAREKSPVGETSRAAWSEVMVGNLDGTFLCCRAGLPLLHAGEGAAIVNTSSGLALKPTPGYGPYSAAKAGILALTRLLAQENAPRVRVNAIAPSAVDTAFLRGGTGRGGDGNEGTRLDMEAYLKTVPLGRIATPEDVVGPILFLLGPAAAYVTGQTLHVNGGLLMP